MFLWVWAVLFTRYCPAYPLGKNGQTAKSVVGHVRAMNDKSLELAESDLDRALLAWARRFVKELAADKHADLYDLEGLSEEQHLALALIVSDYLISSSATLRSSATWVLGELRYLPEGAVESLRALLRDADEQVRLAAAWAVGKFGATGAALVSDLIVAVDDPSEAVQFAILNSLGSLQEVAAPAAPTRSFSQQTRRP
jgi:HEAT repeat protein